MENYVGKIIKISGTNSWGREFTVTGIVYAQHDNDRVGGSTTFSMIKTDGSVASSISVRHDDAIKITSTKIDPELRAALKEAYKTKLKLDAFEEKYNKEVAAHKDAVSMALKNVKANSNELTSNEFIDAVVSLFDEKYPASGNYYTKRFEASSWSTTEVTVQQSEDVDKWANPEKYGFLYREYDNTIHMYHDSKELKEFCERHAPSIIPELAKHCKTSVSASLGDKEWLSVSRRYTFPIKHGYTKKSIEEIKERIFGIRTKLPSVEEQIAMAEGQKTPSGGSRSVEKTITSKGR